MSLSRVVLENFTIFDKLDIQLNEGINVLIGENGTGKTHLMKVLYAACQAAQASQKVVTFPQKIVQVFRPDDSNILRLLSRKAGNTSARVSVYNNKNTQLTTKFNLKTKKWNADVTGAEAWEKQMANLTSTFIPAKEILANSKNLIHAVNAGNVDFDDTYIDIISAASVKLTPGPDSARSNGYLKKLRKIMEGRVTFKDEKFYLRPENQDMLEFQLVAEGLRKIALLWLLIKNGTLEKGSVLFWDEPEANINPRNIPAIVDLLFQLQEDGVQIFIATHDYFLAKYFEIKAKESNSVLFHALYKDDLTGSIGCEFADTFTSLKNNLIIAEQFNIYQEEVRKVLD